MGLDCRKRLVSLLFGACSYVGLTLLLLFASGVHAAFPPADLYFIQNIPGTYPTPQAACEAFVPRYLEGQSPREVIGVVGVWGNDGCAITIRLTAPCCGGLPTGYVGTSYYNDFRTSWPECPTNSTLVNGRCQCNKGHQEDALGTSCLNALPELAARNRCDAPRSGASVGRPIIPATAEKYRLELDLIDTGPASLSFGRTYRSGWGMDPLRLKGSMGKAWGHSHNTLLKGTPAIAPTSVSVFTAEGYARTFVKSPGTSTWNATNSSDALNQAPDGAWHWYRGDDDSTQKFDAAGKLQSVTTRNGWSRAYGYNASGQLIAISNTFGRTLALAYNGNGELTTVTTQDARVIGYSYDSAGRLSSVTYPDGKTRSFAYENASVPHALTGILDESGVRWGTFAYDAQGRATSTELSGGVSRYQVSYPTAGSATVIDPLNTSRNYGYSTTKGKLAVTGGSLPSGKEEADAASRVQDDNGLITSETDFKGIKTDTTWDVARRLPLSVTRAVGTPEAQTVTTQWHATFSLPVLVTESGRTTAYTYDDKGNVLSRAITDTASSPNTTRTWSWTWNPQGLAATETAPRRRVARAPMWPTRTTPTGI
jgi:YD repeat-containing protein